MPLFFFNVRDGEYIADDTGTDLPDLEAARVHAVAFTGELLRDNAAKFWLDKEWTVEVADEAGLIQFTLVFMAVDAPTVSKGPLLAGPAPVR